MSEEQFWLYKQPILQITLSSYHSGLFGLSGLHTKKTLKFLPKWSQIYPPKNLKLHFWLPVLWFGICNLCLPFSIFLKSLMLDKTSGGQRLIILSLFHQKKKVNEIWHFRSVWSCLFCALNFLTFLPLFRCQQWA